MTADASVKTATTVPWKATVLIIEDDADQVHLYSKALAGFRLLTAINGTEALKLVREDIPDVILLDQILAAGEKGTDFLPVLKTELAHVPVVIISGTLDIKGQLQALQGPYSAHYVIEKPVDVDELVKVVSQAIDECGMAEAVRSLRSLERAELLRSNEPERQFTERLGRQQEILKRLRHSSSKANVSHLARDLKASRRTISRDLQELIARGQLDPSVYPEAE
jgi:DNA-binding NtrC family response regulator